MMALSQNTLEFMYPTYTQFDYNNLTADMENGIGGALFKLVPGQEGFVRPTSSFKILNQMSLVDYSKPGLYKTGNKKFDELNI